MVCLPNNSDIWFISPCFVVIIILVCLFEPSCLVGFVLIFLEFNAWILYLHHCPLPLSFQFFPWPPSFSWPPLLYYFIYLIIYVPYIHIHRFYTYMYRHAHPISPFTVVHVYTCTGLTTGDSVTDQAAPPWRCPASPSLHSHWLPTALHAAVGPCEVCSFFRVHMYF